ncbi:hypothetical protein E5288_WYG015008 [Bos mutus]|uniref:Selenocysteine-specific elongation factor 3rd domain-containing protein n=1 Tax=Bos mutus TaxID=72004 RepID=A0A6B0SG62_9CETA|nr:hypothetical protein [Bos mutus]
MRTPAAQDHVVRKVKSMQMFHTPVSSAVQGDRLGICVTQFDPKLLERGLVCAPESLHTVHAALISVEKIPYFRGPLQTKAKFHITVGHETVMGRVMFFGPAPDSLDREPVLDSFDFSREYLFQEQYLCLGPDPAAAHAAEADEKAGQVSAGRCPRQQWALVEFEKPVTCPRLCLVIGSRLDADIHANTCRLAFHGVLLHGLEDRNYAESALPTLRVYKLKQKHGVVERRIHLERGRLEDPCRKVHPAADCWTPPCARVSGTVGVVVADERVSTLVPYPPQGAGKE